MNSRIPVEVIIDANVFISYLLSTTGEGAVMRVVKAAIRGDIETVAPEGLLEEIRQAIGSRLHLKRRVSQEDVDRLVGILSSLPTGRPSPATLPVVSRDPNNDYLLAAALVNDVDYLITGDKDLLSVDPTLTPFLILRPAEFVAVVLDPAGDTGADNP